MKYKILFAVLLIGLLFLAGCGDVKEVGENFSRDDLKEGDTIRTDNGLEVEIIGKRSSTDDFEK